MTGIGDALTAGPVVLDGGLATQLEQQGADLSSSLWSARLLADDPAAIVAAHRTFFAAGSQVATSASYQASLAGFAAVGIDGAAMLRRSVELARQAAGGRDGRWVAASVGPYGATRADGSEYRGDYGLSMTALRRFHRPRLEILAETDADVLAVETIPCLAEVDALLAELDRLDRPAWLSISCVGKSTRAGEPADQAFAMARDCTAVVAVGVNCLDPADVAGLVRTAVTTSGKPAVAYPNRGERWDAAARRWFAAGAFDPAAVPDWIEAGARLVGGCCRVTPADIRAIATAVRRDPTTAGRAEPPTPGG